MRERRTTVTLYGLRILDVGRVLEKMLSSYLVLHLTVVTDRKRTLQIQGYNANVYDEALNSSRRV